MRAQTMAAALAATTFVVAWPAAAAAQAPPPCGGVPQITDTDDGHHSNSNLRAAWFSESAGTLQAVLQVKQGLWEPAHDDSTAVGFVLLYEQAGVRRYVRVEAHNPGVAPTFDHGTWTSAGGFATEGPTTGALTGGANGTATLDVPAVSSGAVLAKPFALTYDGSDGDQPHWVDRAPGGETPAGTEFGADFVAGACGQTGSPDPTQPTDPGAPMPGAAQTTSAVFLDAPERLAGGGTATVTGRVVPARAGVEVDLTATTTKAVTHRLLTAEDGSFAARLPVTETTRMRAVAEGLGSQTATVTVASKIVMKLRRARRGGYLVTGTVRPALPGRVLFVRTTSAHPSARTRPVKGSFRITLRRPRAGRYQAVFIPAGARAERSTSKAGTIR